MTLGRLAKGGHFELVFVFRGSVRKHFPQSRDGCFNSLGSGHYSMFQHVCSTETVLEVIGGSPRGRGGHTGDLGAVRVVQGQAAEGRCAKR